MKERHEIQKCFYNFITLHKVQILFLSWFESFYVTEYYITYPFTKHACPITSRSKTFVWELVSGASIESKHPSLRNLKISHNSQTLDVAPYKNLSDDITTNTKNIIKHNNFTNTNLNTIGKQLTRIEKQIQRIIVSLVEVIKSIYHKLKNLVFKPFQIIRTSQTQFQNNKNDFLKAIKDLLNHLEASSSSLIALDTPQVSNNPQISTSHINIIQNYQTRTSDEETFQEDTLKINKLVLRDLIPKTTIVLDLAIHNETTIINQHKFNTSSLYEWNIDGMSKYNILNILQ